MEAALVSSSPTVDSSHLKLLAEISGDALHYATDHVNHPATGNAVLPCCCVMPCCAWLPLCSIDRLNQVDLPLDSYYSSGDYDGRGVHVYVLDTGVRASHYDFRGRVGDGASAVGSSFADDNGHGTHVSGQSPVPTTS